MDLVQLRHFVLRCNIHRLNEWLLTDCNSYNYPISNTFQNLHLKSRFKSEVKYSLTYFHRYIYIVWKRRFVSTVASHFFHNVHFSNLVIWYKLIHTKVFIDLVVNKDVQHTFNFIYRFNIYCVHHAWLKSVVSIFNVLMCVQARKSYVKVLEQLDKMFIICVWVSLYAIEWSER